MKKCCSCKEDKSEDNFHKDKSRKDGLDRRCKDCVKVHKSRPNILEAHSKQQREYRKNNLEVCRKAEKRRYITRMSNPNNPERLIRNLRSRTRQALAGLRKFSGTIKFLGCTQDELKIYLSSKFTHGMAFENYGEWHIDHIIPCASFDLSLEENQKTCFHYTNLQPLWAIDNLKKSDKIYERF